MQQSIILLNSATGKTIEQALQKSHRHYNDTPANPNFMKKIISPKHCLVLLNGEPQVMKQSKAAKLMGAARFTKEFKLIQERNNRMQEMARQVNERKEAKDNGKIVV